MKRAAAMAGLATMLFGLEGTSTPRRATRGPKAFGPRAQLILTEESVMALFGTATEEWRPKVADKTRGGAEIFAKVAPATVVVRTATGHGTGFFVSADGFLVTNYHVIADGLVFDPRHRASMARVHLGRLAKDRSIELAPEPVEALFYAADRTRDLALLKLAELPPGVTALPYVALSDQSPSPGQPCSMIGHPKAGMLWTFRSCQISAIGRFPADLSEVVVARLGASGPARRAIEDSLASSPSFHIAVSSCEANPGDSGGPVVDQAGKLIAVTFAVPRQAELSKLTYHIHLDEVRAFLDKRPGAPSVLAPDPWELGPKVELYDLEGKGRAQLLEAGTDRQPEQYLFDLDGNTDPTLLRRDKLKELVDGRKFEAELALRRSGQRISAFYDTDNDGTFDLIVVGKDQPGGAAEVVLTSTRDRRWDGRQAGAGERVLDPGRFVDKELGQRLEIFLRKLDIR